MGSVDWNERVSRWRKKEWMAAGRGVGDGEVRRTEAWTMVVAMAKAR